MLRRIQYLIEAAAFFFLIGIFTILGLEAASSLGAWISSSLGPLTPLHKRAIKRMRRVMPEISESEADRILRKMWSNLGRTIGEMPHIGKFRPFEPGGRVEFSDFEIADAIKARDTGAIWVSGHFANWEIMPALMTRFGLRGGVVYRAPNNPHVDKYLVNLRGSVCPLQIPKGPKGVRDIVNLLKNKGHLAMLVDQRMSDGIEVPFFGIPTMTPAAPAQLALRHSVPVIVVALERTKGTDFRAKLFPPIEPQSTGDRDADMKRIMTEVNLRLERIIRERPDQWLWLHRRWPGDK